MMRFFYFLLFVIVIFPPGFALAGMCNDCSSVESLADKLREDWVSKAQSIYDGYIQTPDTTALEDCIGGIDGVGSDISLDVPSMEDLLNEACETLKDTMDDMFSEALNEATGSFSIDNVEGVLIEGGTSSSGNSGTVEGTVDVSNPVPSGSIWDSLN